MHLPHHQEMLRNAAKYGGVDAVTELIRKENPSALHVEEGDNETLSSRVFFHQPMRNEPAKGTIRFYDPVKAAA
ncbi:hypothetical protein J8I87_06140 [Paraburkholderia sp. LEh10]|uniref:hypothetical protein n=1 Tax=Paraburkholderia sp. LEh10 TaxID=2821353 RepID=UPI001AE73863|nr:hypothetical protein [Paraburkholderia sp. LEh10]MBP0589304.1 hypothetical protein [Paraburkholderia sp. LEh10]